MSRSCLFFIILPPRPLRPLRVLRVPSLLHPQNPPQPPPVQSNQHLTGESRQHGSHLPLPRPPLRHHPRQHGRRRHAALRQDHPGDAAALLRHQPLQPHPRHPRQTPPRRHRAPGVPAPRRASPQRLHPRRRNPQRLAQRSNPQRGARTRPLRLLPDLHRPPHQRGPRAPRLHRPRPPLRLRRPGRLPPRADLPQAQIRPPRPLQGHPRLLRADLHALLRPRLHRRKTHLRQQPGRHHNLWR